MNNRSVAPIVIKGPFFHFKTKSATFQNAIFLTPAPSVLKNGKKTFASHIIPTPPGLPTIRHGRVNANSHSQCFLNLLLILEKPQPKFLVKLFSRDKYSTLMQPHFKKDV